MVRWTCPPSQTVKLNVDAASKGNPGHAGCGCIVRSHEGLWLIGAAKRLGVASAFHAEMAAVQTGLEPAWDHGFRSVQL